MRGNFGCLGKFLVSSFLFKIEWNISVLKWYQVFHFRMAILEAMLPEKLPAYAAKVVTGASKEYEFGALLFSIQLMSFCKDVWT